jgi:hypothetical protein
LLAEAETPNVKPDPRSGERDSSEIIVFWRIKTQHFSTKYAIRAWFHYSFYPCLILRTRTHRERVKLIELATIKGISLSINP